MQDKGIYFGLVGKCERAPRPWNQMKLSPTIPVLEYERGAQI